MSWHAIAWNFCDKVRNSAQFLVESFQRKVLRLQFGPGQCLLQVLERSNSDPNLSVPLPLPALLA